MFSRLKPASFILIIILVFVVGVLFGQLLKLNRPVKTAFTPIPTVAVAPTVELTATPSAVPSISKMYFVPGRPTLAPVKGAIK